MVVRFRARSRGHCLIVGLCLAACSRPPRDLPTFGAVAPFTLTSEAAHNFDSKTLEGKVWVADFIYTSCSGPCPRMGSQMRQVQNAFLTNPDVKLVSFTVDPANDTPQVLADYAKRMKAAPDSWRFLTGSPDQLARLMRHDFLLGDLNASLNHSTRFVLVDRRSRIRGFYDTSDESAIPKLIVDIRYLLKEPA